MPPTRSVQRSSLSAWGMPLSAPQPFSSHHAALVDRRRRYDRASAFVGPLELFSSKGVPTWQETDTTTEAAATGAIALGCRRRGGSAEPECA